MDKKFIALDIGGVCLSIHPERCFGALGFKSMEEIPPELLILTTETFERGRITEAELLDNMYELLGKRFEKAFLRQAFANIIGNPIPGMEAWVESIVAKGIQPVFFSDTSSLHIEIVRQRFPAAHLIPEGVYSFETGAKKPEAPMFEAFEKQYGKPLCYIDDRAPLIQVAQIHGWNTHHFTTPSSLPFP